MTGYQSKKDMAQDKLTQPEQEPWRESASDYERGVIDGMQKQAQSSVDKAVNRMAQRTWVDLTNTEIWREYQLLWPFHPAEEPKLAADMITFARAVLAKSKEKNNAA